MRLHRISYYLLPLLYLTIGGIVTAMLVQRVLCYASSVWLVLLVPMVMVTVLLTVVGIVNVWLSYRAARDAVSLRQYSQRSLLWIYLRCWAVVMSGLTLGVLYAWMSQLLPDYMQTLLAHLSVLFYVICTLLTLAALMSIVLGENLEEIRLHKAQTENQLLKSQLNPHFLYNTLNNIDALIWLDQERASSAVTGLSDLMRYMTYSARQETVSLAQEVDAISRLCGLHSLRMSHPDAICLDLPSHQPSQWQVAPLLLVPLVENCFKHCGPTDEARAITIRLVVDEHSIEFSTDNNLPPSTPDAAKPASHHGVGLSTLRRRLDLLYPGNYTFSAGVEGQRFRTRLTIAR